MKVLVISPIFPPEIGGPATYSYELLKRLPPKISVHVLAFGEKIGTDRDATIIPIRNGIIIRQLRLFIACLSFGATSDTFYLMEPAIVGFVGLISAKLLSKKVITKYVGDPTWEERRRKGEVLSQLDKFLRSSKARNDWRFWITRFVLGHSDRVIVPAQHLRRLLIENYALSPNKVDVIFNSVEVKGAASSIGKEFVFVGRLVAWKNLDLVIKAVANIRGKLKIVGDGPETANLKKITHVSGASGRVKFLGQLSRENTLREIKTSVALILFSDYEGLSHVILEAIAAGVPVVASDIPGNDEIIENGVNGLLVKPRDISALEEALVKITDKGLRAKFSMKTIEAAKSRFGWDNNLERLTKVIYEVAEQ